MSLRLRLIVAFFLLSVVPLGALTYYSYQSNAVALRQAAQHEAELLAGELSQRMQMVTAQLSERVEHLMDMSANETVASAGASAPASPTVAHASKPAATAARGATAPAAPVTTPSAASGADVAPGADPMGDRYAAALGEVAMLLNNVELRGMYGGRGGRGGGGGGGRGGSPFPGRDAQPGSNPAGTGPGNAAAATTPGATGAPGPMGSAGSPGSSGSPGSTGSIRAPGASATTVTPGMTGGAGAGAGANAAEGNRAGLPPDRQFSGGGGRRDRAGFPPPGTAGGPPGPGGFGPPPEPPVDDPSKIRIDLRPIRAEMLQQMVPDGQWEKLTPEERQKVFDEINQRILGFVQGIRVGAAELQKKADEAQRQALEQAKITAATPKLSAAPSKPAASRTAPAATTVSGAAPPVRPAVPAAAPASPPAPVPPVPSTPKLAPTAPTPPAAPLSPPSSAAPRTSASAATSQRRTAISGSRMDVTVERNGQVQQVNAELNLDNLLGTVFSNTRRDRGEVPFAVSKDGHLYTPTDADRQVIQSLGTVAKPETPVGVIVLPAWIVVTTQDPSGTGLKFGIARPVGDSLAALRLSTARNAAFGLGFIGLALIGIVPLSGRLTRNLSTLNEGVRRIAHGDYRARVSVTSKDEVGELAHAFNQMAEDVEKHQRAAVEQERIKRELELGRQIQHEMLPHAPFKLGLMEIQGVSVPAREVGGDFFNYFPLPSGQIALLVGDVSGKGVGAALLMANIQASLRTRLSLGQDLAALAREVDLDIESSTPGTVYATLFVGMLDPASRELRFVNAGHHPQYVLRRSGSLERMHSSGLPVGLLAGHGYTEQRVQLAADDVLFFYTDGCVETESEVGEMFGADRLEAVLTSGAVNSADDILVRVERAVSSFRGSREPFDDATMMAVKVG